MINQLRIFNWKNRLSYSEVTNFSYKIDAKLATEDISIDVGDNITTSNSATTDANVYDSDNNDNGEGTEFIIISK